MPSQTPSLPSIASQTVSQVCSDLHCSKFRLSAYPIKFKSQRGSLERHSYLRLGGAEDERTHEWYSDICSEADEGRVLEKIQSMIPRRRPRPGVADPWSTCVYRDPIWDIRPNSLPHLIIPIEFRSGQAFDDPAIADGGSWVVEDLARERASWVNVTPDGRGIMNRLPSMSSFGSRSTARRLPSATAGGGASTRDAHTSASVSNTVARQAAINERAPQTSIPSQPVSTEGTDATRVIPCFMTRDFSHSGLTNCRWLLTRGTDETMRLPTTAMVHSSDGSLVRPATMAGLLGRPDTSALPPILPAPRVLRLESFDNAVLHPYYIRPEDPRYYNQVAARTEWVDQRELDNGWTDVWCPIDQRHISAVRSVEDWLERSDWGKAMDQFDSRGDL